MLCHFCYILLITILRCIVEKILKVLRGRGDMFEFRATHIEERIHISVNRRYKLLKFREQDSDTRRESDYLSSVRS